MGTGIATCSSPGTLADQLARLVAVGEDRTGTLTYAAQGPSQAHAEARHGPRQLPRRAHTDEKVQVVAVQRGVLEIAAEAAVEGLQRLPQGPRTGTPAQLGQPWHEEERHQGSAAAPDPWAGGVRDSGGLALRLAAGTLAGASPGGAPPGLGRGMGTVSDHGASPRGEVPAPAQAHGEGRESPHEERDRVEARWTVG